MKNFSCCVKRLSNKYGKKKQEQQIPENKQLTNTTIFPHVSSNTAAVIIIHSICTTSSIFAWSISTIVDVCRFERTMLIFAILSEPTSTKEALRWTRARLRTAYFIFSYTHYIQLMFTANEFFILKTMTLFSGAQGYILSWSCPFD